jgi:hypothetical protein
MAVKYRYCLILLLLVINIQSEVTLTSGLSAADLTKTHSNGKYKNSELGSFHAEKSLICIVASSCPAWERIFFT